MTMTHRPLSQHAALRERLLLLQAAAALSMSVQPAHEAAATANAAIPPKCTQSDAHNVPAPQSAGDIEALGTQVSSDGLVSLSQQEPKAVSRKNTKRAAQCQAGTKALPDFVPHVRTLTRGKTLLIVGDLCRDVERQRIERLLECKVVWWEAKHREKITPMETAGKKCDLLVSIVRDASHAHTKGLIALSRETGIPVVNVPKGANEIIIAHEINRQILRAA